MSALVPPCGNLTSVLGLGSLFVPASRFSKLAVILKPGTLLRFHEALKERKYRWLFSSGGHRRPGPKGPSKESRSHGAACADESGRAVWPTPQSGGSF